MIAQDDVWLISRYRFLRKTGFPMAFHPDCAHSDSLGSPLQYSTCPCAVGSGAQHRHAEGNVAMFGCIGRELYDPEKVCQIILACCLLHNICLSHGIEEKTKCAWTKMTTLQSQLTGTRTSLRREDGS